MPLAYPELGCKAYLEKHKLVLKQFCLNMICLMRVLAISAVQLLNDMLLLFPSLSSLVGLKHSKNPRCPFVAKRVILPDDKWSLLLHSDFEHNIGNPNCYIRQTLIRCFHIWKGKLGL